MEKIDHPNHYQGAIECIDAMRLHYGFEQVKSFCRLSAFKYRYRAGQKEGEDHDTDIKKAEWYEQYLLKFEEV